MMRGVVLPGSGSAPSATTAAAPRPTASAAKRRPSCLKPEMATKSSPSATFLESEATPVTRPGRVPRTVFSGSASISVVVGTAVSLMSSRLEARGDRGMGGPAGRGRELEPAHRARREPGAGRRDLARPDAPPRDLETDAERREGLHCLAERDA